MTDTAETPEAEVPVQLPEWLEELLPAHRTPQRLSTAVVDGNRVLRLLDPDGSFADFSTVREASEANSKSGYDIIIDDEVFEHFSERRSRRHLSYPLEKGYVGMLFSYTDEDRRRSLERAYAASLENQALYAEDPQDFRKAWYFIESHPAFWTCQDVNEHPWHWETQGYCSKLRQHLYFKEGEGSWIGLEGGGHVDKAHDSVTVPYRDHYGDWRVQAAGKTFEEAIIKLAFKVSKAFDSEGNSLREEDFPMEPPEWVKELRESLAEIDREDES